MRKSWAWTSSPRRSIWPAPTSSNRSNVPAYKIASGDLKSVPLLKHVASFGKPMIVSTGGAQLEDVQRAYDAILPINPQLAILQCTAGYPAATEELDLRVISTYRERFPDAVIGFSSHDNGIVMPVAAYMLGARIVEKHFTLNRAMKGTDHAFSLEPVGLRKMVRDLDRTFKAMGDGTKKLYDSERAPIVKMGKSLVVAQKPAERSRARPQGHRHEVARRRHSAVRARQGDRPDDAQAASRGRLPVVRRVEQVRQRVRARS